VVELVLVRHGRTAWNAERRFLGCTDLPLDDVGLAEAATLPARPGLLPLSAVYASPLRRALDTARVLDPAPRILPDLREMHQGELEGLLGPEAVERFTPFFERWVEDPSGVAPPGGETLDEVRSRAWSALCEIAAAHRAGERVAIVTHQMVIAAVCTAAADAPLRAWRDYGVPNVGTRTLVGDGVRLRLRA
jgi:broad specificity phosphatase PhoE